MTMALRREQEEEEEVHLLPPSVRGDHIQPTVKGRASLLPPNRYPTVVTILPSRQ